MHELTTTEAVRTYGMHPATILRLILTRRVTARKDSNGRWRIRRRDLDAWASRKKKKLNTMQVSQ